MTKEYLVDIAVNTTYQLVLKAEKASDLENYHDNKEILPLETRNTIEALIRTTGFNNCLGEIVDKHCEILEVVCPEEELMK